MVTKPQGESFSVDSEIGNAFTFSNPLTIKASLVNQICVRFMSVGGSQSI